jgi:hypothetical protein
VKSFALFVLGIVLFSGTANAGFIGNWQLENWTASGPGTVTITPPSGPADSATFSYIDNFAGFSDVTWTYSDIAASGGTVSFNYEYSGYHAFFAVTTHFSVFAGSNVINLVNAGPANCCTPPSGGFDYIGTATIHVNPGDTFGFMVGGRNGDSDNRLIGNLTITNFETPTPEPASFGLLGGGAAMLALGAWRRKRTN